MDDAAFMIAVCDAVTARLNAVQQNGSSPFDEEFVAVRRYNGRFEKKELTEIKVSVLPGPIQTTGGTRKQEQVEFEVFVAVQAQATQDRADALMLLLQQIGDVFRFLPLGTLAVCSGTDQSPAYDTEDMKNGVFTAIRQLHFKGMR